MSVIPVSHVCNPCILIEFLFRRYSVGLLLALLDTCICTVQGDSLGNGSGEKLPDLCNRKDKLQMFQITQILQIMAKVFGGRL